jgi:hypothetical protein
MVMARLHLICGNCGSNDQWEWKYHEKEVCDGEVIADENVHLYCNNCSTIHTINDNAKKLREKVRC